VIGCNLVGLAAQNFFFESVATAAGIEVPPHPLLNNASVQKFLSSLGVLIPMGVVAVLPSRTFFPVGRTPVMAALLSLAASWAFY
jgi:hypothetical protein